MTKVLIAIAAICLFAPAATTPVSAQDVDARCKDVYDKVACGCAVQNGGQIIPPPGGIKREGLKLRPTEGRETTQTLDGGRVAFPKYFRRDGLKIHKSRALEGYMACMRSNGRK
jgi:hypothetical protein